MLSINFLKYHKIIIYKFLLIIILWLLNSIFIYSKDKIEINPQLGHSFINSLTFSPCGKFILSNGKDKIKLWEIRSFKEIRTFSGSSQILSLDNFSPDSKNIAVAFNNQIIIYDINTGDNIISLNDNDNQILMVKYFADGKNIISAGKNGTMNIWDLKTNKIVKILNGHKKNINSIAFSLDDKYIISGSGDKTVKLWDKNSGKQLWSYDNYDSEVISVGYHSKLNCAVSASKKKITLLDINTGKVTNSYKLKEDQNNNNINNVLFSSTGEYYIVVSSTLYPVNVKVNMNLTENGTSIKEYDNFFNIPYVNISIDNKLLVFSNSSWMGLWDNENKRFINNFNGYNFLDAQNSSIYSPDNKFFISTNGYNIICWQPYSRGKMAFKNEFNQMVNAVCFSSDGNDIFVGYGDTITKVRFKNDYFFYPEFLQLRSKDKSGNVISLSNSPDGKYIISGYSNNMVRLWDLENKKEAASIKIKVSQNNLTGIKSVHFSTDGKYILCGSYNNTITLLKLANKKLKEVKNVQDLVSSSSVVVSPDNKHFAFGTGNNIKISAISNFKETAVLKGHGAKVNSICYSTDGKYIVSGSSDNSVRLWDVKTKKLVKTFNGHLNAVTSVDISEDGSFILSTSLDYTTRIWDVKTGNYTAFILNNRDKALVYDWLMFTNDGYWDSSINGGNEAAVIKGLHGYNIDQFAVKNNRPDIILKRLGANDTELITYFYNQYLKRLKKYKITEPELSNDYNVPEVEIVGAEIKGKFINLKFNIQDDKYKLKSYNIYMNNVPLFGTYGRPVEKGTKNKIIKQTVELTPGKNKIEISCFNEKGVESFRAATYANYSPPENNDKKINSDLYFLGFGISDYKDSSLNLGYAAKDAKDLSELFLKMKNSYNNVHIKTYINEKCTVKNIINAKDFLKNAKPDDTFILFIAGHGLYDYDKEATYYYLTYETDLNNLKETAANFDLLEDILQNIPPRKKIFFMDTCQSGEIEDEKAASYNSTAEGRGISARTIRGLKEKITNKKIKNKKRTYLYDRNRYIYNDLLRRSGTIVFSSSKGNEFSYESDKIENGFFTEEIINAISNKKADKDLDKMITKEELFEYIKNQVSKSTNKLQNPTIDRDNIYIDFKLPVIY